MVTRRPPGDDKRTLRKAQHSLLVQSYKLHLCWHSTHISTTNRLHFSFWREIPGTGSPPWQQLNNGTMRKPVSQAACAYIHWNQVLLSPTASTLPLLKYTCPGQSKRKPNHHHHKPPQGRAHRTKSNKCHCAPPTYWLQLSVTTRTGPQSVGGLSHATPTAPPGNPCLFGCHSQCRKLLLIQLQFLA